MEGKLWASALGFEICVTRWKLDVEDITFRTKAAFSLNESASSRTTYKCRVFVRGTFEAHTLIKELFRPIRGETFNGCDGAGDIMVG